MGLAKALGLNLRKDAFSDANMKSREHQTQIKEKLIFAFWRKLNEENLDLTPTKNSDLPGGSSMDLEIDGETIDSTSNCNSTPKSKTLGKQEESGV
jgi:hypothetical protein